MAGRQPTTGSAKQREVQARYRERLLLKGWRTAKGRPKRTTSTGRWQGLAGSGVAGARREVARCAVGLRLARQDVLTGSWEGRV